jgi:membrane protease YdiL (CAAX protease family)
VLRPLLPEALRAISPPSRWISVSSAFYGGIIEELFMRWGLLPLAMLGLGRAGLGRKPAFWTANGAVALVFGLGHLPLVRQLHVALTPAVLGYVLVGNGLAGLAFGWLFRRRGLESAMVAHAVADVWLQAVLR